MYFFSAWYFSAPPFRNIFLQVCLWPRRQWSCWQVESQYLNLHRTHRGALRASGAAQAAQFVRIILRFAVSYVLCGGLTRLEKPVFYASIRGVHQHRNRNTVYHTLST